MFQKVVFTLAILLLAAGAAQAQCAEPVAPAALDGTTATADQLRTAMANARDFIAQANLYQACIKGQMDDARTQTGGDRNVADPGVQDGDSKIAASQKMKEKVSLDANTAMNDYKKSHAD